MSDPQPRLFSRDAAERRAWLNQADEALRYYIPPELRSLAGLVADMGPVAAHQRATQAVQGVTAPGRTSSERLLSGVDLAAETAGMVAGPLVLGRYLRAPASEVASDLLLGMGAGAAPTAEELAGDLARRQLAPPPATIEVPPVVDRADADEYLALWNRLSTPDGLSPAEEDGFLELRARAATGEFDQFLPEDALRGELREFLDEEDMGILSQDPVTQQRFANLNAMFPDEAERFQQDLDAMLFNLHREHDLETQRELLTIGGGTPADPVPAARPPSPFSSEEARQAAFAEYRGLDWVVDTDDPRQEWLYALDRAGEFDSLRSEDELRRIFLNSLRYGHANDAQYPGSVARQAALDARFPGLREAFGTASEYEALIDQLDEDLTPPQLARRDELFGRSMTGEFDEFLSDNALKAELERLLLAEAEGRLVGLESMGRLAALSNRFPEQVEGFQNPNAWRPPPSLPSGPPQRWGDQGLASLYSRSERAADRLAQPTYSDPMQLRRELEARGARPAELDWQMRGLEEAFANSGGRLSREQVQQTLAGIDGLTVERTDAYANYGPPGGRGYQSTVYRHNAVQNGPGHAYLHFGARDDSPPLFHSRSAEYDLQFPDGGTTHHVLEIQSDWAQFRQTLPSSLEQRAAMEEELGRLRQKPAVDLTVQEFTRARALEQALQTGLLRADFDAAYPAPYLRNENDWVDAGVRQNILDAVNTGTDWITFGNGKQAADTVGMPERAAARFYDERVPSRVENVLSRLARDNGIDPRSTDWWPQLQEVPFVDGQPVRGFRITPQFREFIRESGLPTFRDGGPVRAGGLASLARAETIEPHSPSLRDRARWALSDVLGPVLGQRIAGSNTDVGLLDMTPAGTAFAVQEGSRAAARGARSGDIPEVLMGAGEALMAVTPLPLPGARVARTMAASGGRRGGDSGIRYSFERVWDPEQNRYVTRVQQRMREEDDVDEEALAAARRRRPRPARAQPPAGPEAPVIQTPAQTRDPATGRRLQPPRAGAGMTPTLEEQIDAAADAFPTELSRVRLPLSAGQQLPGQSPRGAYDPQSGRAYRTAATAAPGRRLSAEALEGDPSHEWVEVPMSVLSRLGMRPENLRDPVTRLSPDARTAYLGPSDVPRLMTAWQTAVERGPLIGMSVPPVPSLTTPRVLPNRDVLSYPGTAPAQGSTWEELRRRAREATRRSEEP